MFFYDYNCILTAAVDYIIRVHTKEMGYNSVGEWNQYSVVRPCPIKQHDDNSGLEM